MINAECRVFQETWNAHPISGLGHDQSPNVSTSMIICVIVVYLTAHLLGYDVLWTNRTWYLC